MMEYIGWTGALLFAICGLPQAIQCYRAGHSRGLDWMFLICWLFGEILTIIYIWPKNEYPLLFNYLANLVFLGVMIFYKIWERPQG